MISAVSISKRSPERLVFFTDAVVAIAITLLILPLADAVPEAVAQHLDPTELISDNQGKIYSFLLSFVVIARLWMVHHQVFGEVKAYNMPLVAANFGWLLAIVVLPFPTEVAGLYGNEPFEASFYIAPILVAALFQTVMVLIIRRDRNLRDDDSDVATKSLFIAVSNMVALAIAFAVAALVPHAGYYMLLLLLLPPILARFSNRRDNPSEQPSTV
jgi:TMEM175 potassium channel family protein